ncbi:FlgN protein [Desulfonispora thiosulfatigenes DSM 11270]|uniref:Flagellar protein FliT n=1 Tax=Desulfonispora thiosulfatigenes DSM 11270 TaxID=656914 RepID=A0A1W1UPJ9_DESTI|nr:flagellar export chaperone FlgN [Desulfonispora thiosulfatigenes]SMB82751.1 FlgN protein [Desulfonispora thiosulfatigenes DSM 11270]
MNNYLDNLKEKKNLMLEFLSLTEKQHEIITEQDYDQLFTVLNEKQSIMERVNILDLEFQKYTLPKDDITKQLFQEIKALVEKAMHIDDKNIEHLQTNRDEIAAKIKQAHKNKQTHFEYQGKNKSIEGILVDKKK